MRKLRVLLPAPPFLLGFMSLRAELRCSKWEIVDLHPTQVGRHYNSCGPEFSCRFLRGRPSFYCPCQSSLPHALRAGLSEVSRIIGDGKELANAMRAHKDDAEGLLCRLAIFPSSPPAGRESSSAAAAAVESIEDAPVAFEDDAAFKHGFPLRIAGNPDSNDTTNR